MNVDFPVLTGPTMPKYISPFVLLAISSYISKLVIIIPPLINIRFYIQLIYMPVLQSLFQKQIKNNKKPQI